MTGQKSREQPKNEEIYMFGGKRNVFSFPRKDWSDEQLRRDCGREFQIVDAAYMKRSPAKRGAKIHIECRYCTPFVYMLYMSM